MSNPPAAFEMLADPTRYRLVETLHRGERSVGSLVAALSISQPGVSRQLRILNDAGFVRVRADGRRRLYSLRQQPFRDLDRWMDDYRDLVVNRLDRLGGLVRAAHAPLASPSVAHRRAA